MITNSKTTTCFGPSSHCVHEIKPMTGQYVTKETFGKAGFVCWSCAECLPIDETPKVTLEDAKALGIQPRVIVWNEDTFEFEYKES